MIRVLHAVGKLHRAGQETITMNIYRRIDRERVQFDFLVHTFSECAYDREVLALGGRLYPIRKATRGVIRYVLTIRRIVRDNRYDIVHLHTAHSAGFLVLLGAKLGGARVRVAHSRNNMAKPVWLHKLLRPLIARYSTDRFACSEQAGKWMFPRATFRVLRNAIDTRAFRFSPETRAQTRTQLGLGDSLTLGHIGRFTEQKNHPFLLDICQCVKKRRPDVRLLLVGDGERMEDMRKEATARGLTENVLFLGARPDVPALLCAMDVFVFPSLYEGFGNVVIEAQASGVTCLVADTLTRDTRATEKIDYLPLGDAQRWADAILAAGNGERELAAEQVARAGFDVAQAAQDYQAFYEEAERRCERTSQGSR